MKTLYIVLDRKPAFSVKKFEIRNNDQNENILTRPATRQTMSFGLAPFANPTRPNGFIRAGKAVLAGTGTYVEGTEHSG